MNDHLEKLLRRQRSLSLLRKKLELERQAILDPLQTLLSEEAQQAKKIEALQTMVQSRVAENASRAAQAGVKKQVTGKNLSNCFEEAYVQRKSLQRINAVIGEQLQALDQMRVEADRLLQEMGHRLQQDSELLQEMKKTKSELTQLADIVEAEAIAEIAPFLDSAIYARGAA